MATKTITKVLRIYGIVLCIWSGAIAKNTIYDGIKHIDSMLKFWVDVNETNSTSQGITERIDVGSSTTDGLFKLFTNKLTGRQVEAVTNKTNSAIAMKNNGKDIKLNDSKVEPETNAATTMANIGMDYRNINVETTDNTHSTRTADEIDAHFKRKKLTVKSLFEYKLRPDRKFLEPTVESRRPHFYLDVDMVLQTLVELEDDFDMLSTVVEFSVAWMDTSFKWNLDRVPRANISLPEDMVWKPGIVIVNPQVAQDVGRQLDVKSVVRFSHDGKATWLFTRNIDTKCEVDTTYYPFDTQTCHIKIRFDLDTSLTVNLNNVNFLGDNNNWNISFYSVETAKDRDTGHCVLDIRLDLDRKPLAIILNVILPIFILVTLSPLVFMLPKEPGDRLGLSLTTLLAVSVYMTMVADTLPKTSDPIPVISIVLFVWYISNTCIVIIILINAKVARLGDGRKPPMWIRKATFVSAHFFQLKVPCRRTKSHHPDEENQTKTIKATWSSRNANKIMPLHNGGGDIMLDENHDNNSDDESTTSSAENHVDLSDTHVSVTWRQVSTILDRWLVLTIYMFKFTILAVLLNVFMDVDVSERPVVECKDLGPYRGIVWSPHVPISYMNETGCDIKVPHYQQTSEARLLICPEPVFTKRPS